MKRENNPLILCLFGILPVVWLGLLIAPAAHGGLPEIVARFPAVMNDPFHIELCGDSLKTVIVLLCAYGLTVGVILSSRRNYRRGEEHGSAKWGSARTVNRNTGQPHQRTTRSSRRMSVWVWTDENTAATSTRSLSAAAAQAKRGFTPNRICVKPTRALPCWTRRASCCAARGICCG